MGLDELRSDFSVLISCYAGDDPNRFDSSISSILNNSLKAQQIILVQDGPLPQRMSEILSKYISEPTVKHVIIEKNGGLVNALNHGLTHVKTTYVLRCDADDINSPTRFEQQMKVLTSGFDLVGSSIEEYNSEGVLLSTKIMPANSKEINKFIKYRNPFNHMTVGFKYTKVVEVGGYPNLFLKEDYGLWAKLISSGCKVINVNQVWVKVVRDNAMYSRRSGIKHIKSEFYLQLLLVQLGLQSFHTSILIFIIRSLAVCSPVVMKSFLYSKILRSKLA